VGREDLVGVIEAVYRVDAPEQEWVAGLLDAARPSLERGLGAAAYLYNASRIPLRIWNVVERDSVIPIQGIVDTVQNLDDAYADKVARRLYVGAASEAPGFHEQRGVNEQMFPHGVRDTLSVNAYHPSGTGIFVGAPLPRETKLSARRRAVLGRVAAHMATALGLRVRLGTTGVAAVLTPGGRVEHAEAEAKERDARDALREAAIAIDRARGKLRHDDSERAVGLWKARVAARWTLVDQFESDGKRYVVARTNELPTGGLHPLTPSEEHVLALLAQGRTSKLVAYELGIAPATVRVLTARGAQKLGVRSAAEAIESYRRLVRELRR
jgi:DNA-binding CsgD family transcriptional regulator